MSTISELVVDAYGCSGPLNDPKKLEKKARAVLSAIGATVVESVHHQFQPHGLTLCLILKESHFVVSTWPEHEMAIVNIFLCNPEMDTMEVWKGIAEFLKPSDTNFHEIRHVLKPIVKKRKSA